MSEDNFIYGVPFTPYQKIERFLNDLGIDIVEVHDDLPFPKEKFDYDMDKIMRLVYRVAND